METVLVTGGSGFIALHCIDQLLEKGYKVRTTIRSNNRENEISKAMSKYSDLDLLTAELSYLFFLNIF